MGNAQSTADDRSTTTASTYATAKPNRNRPSGPSPYNFFDGHLEATRPTPPPTRKKSAQSSANSSIKTPSANSSRRAPSAQTKTSQKSTGHINFFEVAAVTPEPLPPPKKISKPPTPASSTQYSQTSFLFSSVTSTTSRSSHSSCHCSLAKSSYLTIDGRAYYRDHILKKFMLPCDDEEVDRLTTMHYILKIMFQWNFTSPIHDMLTSKKDYRVLDIGCGPGTWTLEMATEYPNTEFYAIDQCPLFPTAIKPPNAHFQTHDILKSLPFENESFDFIYMRSMMLYLSPTELSNLLYEIHRIMKPGAYFEVVDTNYTIRRAGPLSNSTINTELKQRINPVDCTNASTQHPLFAFLTAASPNQPTISFLSHFVDISQEHVALPLGYWTGQQLDLLHSQNFKKFLSSLHFPDNPLKTQEIHTVMEECERYKSYMDWFTCYARKPVLDQEIEANALDSINEFVNGFEDF